MKFKNYNINKKVNFENNDEYGFNKVIKLVTEKVIEKVREEVLSEEMNELFENMKESGVNNVDEYVLNIVNERALIDSIDINISSRYSIEQAEELNSVYDSLSNRELKVINNSKANYENMKIASEYIKEGLPIDKLELLDISKLSKNSLKELKSSIDDNITKKELKILISVGEHSDVHNVVLVKEILEKHGLIAAQYASNSKLTFNQRHEINIALKNGISLSVVRNLLTEDLDSMLMQLVTKGLVEYNINLSKMKHYRRECLDENLSYPEAYDLLMLMNRGSNIYA